MLLLLFGHITANFDTPTSIFYGFFILIAEISIPKPICVNEFTMTHLIQLFNFMQYQNLNLFKNVHENLIIK